MIKEKNLQILKWGYIKVIQVDMQIGLNIKTLQNEKTEICGCFQKNRTCNSNMNGYCKRKDNL